MDDIIGDNHPEIIEEDYDYALRLLCSKDAVRWRKTPMGCKDYYLTYGKEEIVRTVFTWNMAMDWARSHGVKLKKGKITKYTARIRIYDAGLMKEFNREWPEYSFNKYDVDIARSSEDSRVKMYKLKSMLDH